ncbi:MAG: glycosyltransferase family 4 protein [Chloroflexi bacterium]|nr:glycosyltransferase family 4 protein [Chloroflexota bacterium]
MAHIPGPILNRTGVSLPAIGCLRKQPRASVQPVASSYAEPSRLGIAAKDTPLSHASVDRAKITTQDYLRIALVAPFGLRSKGTTRARVLPLGRELAGRGHAVALFIPPYDSPEDSGRRRREGGESSEFDVINIALPRFGRDSAAWHLLLAWRLFRAVITWRPDVVHVFKPKGPSGLVAAALWATRRRTNDGRPTAEETVVRRSSLVVDADDWEGPGGWNDDPRLGYSPLRRRFFAWQERFGLSHADAWTVASECLRDRAIRFGAAPDRVFVLPNGVTDFRLQIADCRLEEVQSAIRNPQSAILYTRFAGVSPADVAAIWAAVREKVPATLTVVGRGLAGEERELAGLPGIEVAGWVEPERLPAIFAQTALAVIPWADTPANRARSSVKVRQLMAAGLPIVAYAVGELPATLGDAGVLVPPEDAVAFAEAVVGLMADPERAQRLGAAARAQAQAEFSWEKLAETALRAYRVAGAERET